MGEAAGGNPPKAVVSWSTGKDCAYALHTARRSGDIEVVGLLTTLTRSFGRVSMHGVREELLEAQARALGLPLTRVEIPFPCPNEVYERAMGGAVARLRSDGVSHFVFGDLFLEDVRQYREERLRTLGLTGVFPLWKRPTPLLAREMLAAGIRARVVCIDPRRLDRSFAGRAFDDAFLEDLPEGVDPLGENGEFHTFVTDAPGFRSPVGVSPGEVVERDGFVFADLRPSGSLER